MKSKRLFTAIGNIDDKFIIEDSENSIDAEDIKVVWFTSWLKFAVPLAACLMIAVSIYVGNNGFFVPPYNGGNESLYTPHNSTVEPNNTIDNNHNNATDNPINPSVPSVDSTTPYNAIPQQAYGFVIDGRLYADISFADRKKYGLVPQEDWGMTPENYYVITEKDLGGIMGVVESSEDESLIGATVYHFATFPDSYAICIVDRGEGTPTLTNDPVLEITRGSENSRYVFYTFSYILSLDGASSDTILNAYGMTKETVSQIEALDSDRSPVVTISDMTKISALLEVILQGYEDIGLAAHEELMENWLIDYDPNWRDNDQRFMELQQRLFIISNKKTGLEMSFIYNPFIRSLCTHNSYYILSEESTAILNTLLLVNQ